MIKLYFIIVSVFCFSCIKQEKQKDYRENIVKRKKLSKKDKTYSLREALSKPEKEVVKEILIEGKNFTSIPKEILYFEQLKVLVIKDTKIETLPFFITKLKTLEKLIIYESPVFREIPDFIGNLNNLEQIAIQDSRVKSLPSSIGKLKRLNDLNLVSNHNLDYMPKEIGNLDSLGYILLTDCNFRYLPNEIGKLKNLGFLELSGNCFSNSEILKIDSLIQKKDRRVQFYYSRNRNCED